MGVRHVENVETAAAGQRIGAQHHHLLIDDRFVEAAFVFPEIRPFPCVGPAGIAADPDAVITGGERQLQPLAPFVSHALEIENALLQVAVLAWHEFDIPADQRAVGSGKFPVQRLPGSLFADRLGEHPKAQLVVLDAGLEIGHQHLEQILIRLIEDAEMSSPGPIAEHPESGFAHGFGGLLHTQPRASCSPEFASPALPRKPDQAAVVAAAIS